jgi:hypothetical protein
MENIADIIRTQFVNGENILKTIDNLGQELLNASTQSRAIIDVVLTLQNIGGVGIVLVIRNGSIILDRHEMVAVAKAAADKVQSFACNLTKQE